MFRVMIGGGNTNNATNAGLLYLNANNSTVNRNRNIGTRLAVGTLVVSLN